MAELGGTLQVDIGLEPTEQTRQFVRSIVVDVLKEMLASAAFGEDISKIVDTSVERAMTRMVTQSRLTNARRLV